MKHVFKWVRTTMVLGLASILPLVLIAWVLYWLYNFIIYQVQPVAELISLGVHIDIIIASLITVGLILLICFLLGVVVRTRIGRFFHNQIEKNILRRIPGYTVTKEVVLTFSGEQETPFSCAVLCSPFGGKAWMTGFITDRTRNRGVITVFVPTGPNPTSGNIYHLPAEDVIELKGKVEQGIKTVIGCGAGSCGLIEDSTLDLSNRGKPDNGWG
jgi:uncharacterized membrane protein